MEASLFSPRWYCVAGLRPRLRTHVELKRQLQRGVAWFVLADTTSERRQRLNRIAYQFVGRCDGRVTVQNIWDDLLAARPEDALPQDEVIQLLIQLHERGLIQFDVAPDIETLFRSQEQRQRAARRNGVNPLAFRISLGDPSRLLDRCRAITPRLFSTAAFALWLAVVLFGGVAALLHASELAAAAHQVLTSPRYLLMTWLAYPLVKLVHELAHGLAVRRWGGSVRQAGVMLFMLTPVPFVNASAADGFRHRHQRAIVSAAGIAAELLLAALAALVWLAVQPGLLRDLAFIVMFIGGVSTVLANGNPLLRFDGYFFLCDLLDLQNLATRSGRWWLHQVASRLLGKRAAGSVDPLPGERGWLIAYAPLAWSYRLALSAGIALWLGSFSTLLGVVTGLLMIYSLLGLPVVAAWRGARERSASGAERGRLNRRALTGAAAVLAFVVFLPLPYNTLGEGVVWLPERAQVRAGTDGFIHEIVAADGQRVKAGDVIARLADDRLAADHASRLADAADLEVQLFDAESNDPQRAPALRERLAYARAEAERIEQRQAELDVRAQADGTLVLPQPRDLPGSFRKKGELLGYVLTGEPPVVRVALPQQDAALVRGGRADVGVRLAEEAGRPVHAGQVRLDMPQAVERLPSAALGDRGGGHLATDADDKDGLKTASAVVLMDVAVDAPPAARVGGRATVRFGHTWTPLGVQWLRRLQQQVLQHFNPGN
jgi:putative peptide zinc metalloprotease protein